jgi:SAM-dependent methyltransferase
VLHGEFNDPRLAPIYDLECPLSHKSTFFLDFVKEKPASRVLDLGCGTGQLTLAMAAAGHTVTGVDPAAASLAIARTKPGAGRVKWIDGTSSAIPDGPYDTATMTSHVAQFLATDDEWANALGHLRSALVDDGRIVFDSRDPRARGWERWNPAETRHRRLLPDGSTVEIWAEITSVRDGVVALAGHYVFADGDERLSTATMRFRTEEEIRSSLAAAGFAIDHIFGGWNREPIGAPDGELLVVAHAKEDR